MRYIYANGTAPGLIELIKNAFPEQVLACYHLSVLTGG